ncbi:hypothetical protein BC831DRAFT_118404 [Entophlyctis helioformis]|nr:hypothetical protein BC831DRAFT_118404 [Entophlyctis helioformis]
MHRSPSILPVFACHQTSISVASRNPKACLARSDTPHRPRPPRLLLLPSLQHRILQQPCPCAALSARTQQTDNPSAFTSDSLSASPAHDKVQQTPSARPSSSIRTLVQPSRPSCTWPSRMPANSSASLWPHWSVLWPPWRSLSLLSLAMPSSPRFCRPTNPATRSSRPAQVAW